MTARVAVAVLLAVAACGGTHDYAAHGRVVAVDVLAGTVTIDHDDIPGLMGAMTMRFRAASPALLESVRPDAAVRFVVRDEAGGLVVVAIAPEP